MRDNSVLLIIGGGIAAYKSLELIRRLKELGISTRAILTNAGERFVTPLSVSALTGKKFFRISSASPMSPRWGISNCPARRISLSSHRPPPI